MKLDARVVKVGKAREKRQTVSGDVAAGLFQQSGQWISFVFATVRDVRFGNCRFLEFYAEASTFEACDFRGARFLGGTLGPMRPNQTRYRRCDFRGVDLRSVDAGNARFEDCLFQDARLDGWTPDCAEFIDCTFAGRIHGARFTGTTKLCPVNIGRPVSEFRGNDFRSADLDLTSFEYGIDLRQQQLPTGPEYIRLVRARLPFATARAAIAQWPDEADRRGGEFLLQILSKRGYAAQEEIFTKRYAFTGAVSRDPATRFWALIEPVAGVAED